MLNANDAMKVMKETHDKAYKEARERWVPYWMDKLAAQIENAASLGRGAVKFSLRWHERLGASHVPDYLVMQYTEKIFDEELARDTGYYVIKKDGGNIPTYEVVWYSENYDAYREARANGCQEKEDYPFPTLS